jgi:hypothetical protein
MQTEVLTASLSSVLDADRESNPELSSLASLTAMWRLGMIGILMYRVGVRPCNTSRDTKKLGGKRGESFFLYIKQVAFGIKDLK